MQEARHMELLQKPYLGNSPPRMAVYQNKEHIL